MCFCINTMKYWQFSNDYQYHVHLYLYAQNIACSPKVNHMSTHLPRLVGETVLLQAFPNLLRLQSFHFGITWSIVWSVYQYLHHHKAHLLPTQMFCICNFLWYSSHVVT